MEAWDQMTERHKRERRELVKDLAAKRITQTEAARMVDTTLAGLNNYIKRNNIFWPVIEQGAPTRWKPGVCGRTFGSRS